MQHYYVRHKLTAEQRIEYEATALSQELEVLKVFKTHPSAHFIPEQLQAMIPKRAPITSIRRAVTNLHQLRYIDRVEQVEGPMGRPVYTYKYNKGSE